MATDNKKESASLYQTENPKNAISLPEEAEVNDLAEFFKVFGDPTRIRILFLLKEKEYCVQDITQMLEMKQTAVSHQLTYLRHARLVKYRKDGKRVFYSLNDNHIDEILATGFDHISEK